MKPGVPFILVTMLLDWLVNMLSPVLPNLLVAFKGGHVSNASAILGWFSAAFAVAQFVASPVLGVLSDRYGRRPIVLLSSVGSTLDCLILAVAPDLAWLFVGRVLSGGTAASATTGAAGLRARAGPRRPARGDRTARAVLRRGRDDGRERDLRRLRAAGVAAAGVAAAADRLGPRESARLAGSILCSNLAVQAFSIFVLYTIFRFH